LRKLIVDLDHIDGAIRLFDPGYDIAGIRDKPVRPYSSRAAATRSG
jgi:hypothetical protein